ncbi:GmrSD restriction endonuclease domain-containing protein [Haliea sp. E17]|uniref:GmrSD restriction endonuclease domain-containing protein n=1 Tax=Haliea sp. E17 TaxID=3401576 RepID=UPI003AAD6266
MPSFNTEISTFKDIVSKANSGDYKLPAFQRKWKWNKKQVLSLYDSLRMGYPIGAILTMTSEDIAKLNPRPFYGVSKKAAANLVTSTLILDGQQRITAGISIYFGISQDHGTEYYIDVGKLMALAKERKLNVEDEDAVKSFADSIDTDDGYLVSKPRRKDRESHLKENNLMWTPYLTQENESRYSELLDELFDAKSYEKKFIRRVVKTHFSPNLTHQVPMIELPKHFDLSAVSRVFTTINTTGKLLTPFELVVAILFPNDIFLEDEIEAYKSKFTHYSNMDSNGEILLQTVAMLSNLSPKKSDLPKNIDHINYSRYADEAAQKLERLGVYLTNTMGVALDVKSKYIPYDAVFAPMALALDYAESLTVASKKGAAKDKIEKWFVGSVLSQRYQEGVHNKQSKDFHDFKRWVDGDIEPEWIGDVVVPLHLKSASPSGALGKLVICMLNRAKPNDPVQGGQIGYFNTAPNTQDHHIFPTRWAAKGLIDGEAKKDDYTTNLALNIMLVEATTNGDWLNFSPLDQINNAESARGDKVYSESYEKQFISKEAYSILKKSSLNVSDYDTFIAKRFETLAAHFSKTYGFATPIGASEEDEEQDLEEPA